MCGQVSSSLCRVHMAPHLSSAMRATSTWIVGLAAVALVVLLAMQPAAASTSADPDHDPPPRQSGHAPEQHDHHQHGEQTPLPARLLVVLPDGRTAPLLDELLEPMWVGEDASRLQLRTNSLDEVGVSLSCPEARALAAATAHADNGFAQLLSKDLHVHQRRLPKLFAALDGMGLCAPTMSLTRSSVVKAASVLHGMPMNAPHPLDSHHHSPHHGGAEAHVTHDVSLGEVLQQLENAPRHMAGLHPADHQHAHGGSREHHDDPGLAPAALAADAPTLSMDASLAELRLCSVSDVGADNFAQREVAAGMLRAGCTHVLMAGDLIYPDGLRDWDSSLLEYCQQDGHWYAKADEDWFRSPCSRLYTNFLEPYADLLAAGTKLYLVAGNHDYGRPSAQGQLAGSEDKLSWERVQSWLHVTGRSDLGTENVFFPHPFYSIVNNHTARLCVLMLDTEELRSTQTPGCRSQQAFVRARMAQLGESCAFSLAVGHTPSRSSGHHGCHEAAPPLWRLPHRVVHFWEHELLGRVDVGIGGHDHQISHEGEDRGTEIFVTGAGGGNPRRLSPTEYLRWPRGEDLLQTPCKKRGDGAAEAGAGPPTDCSFGFLHMAFKEKDGGEGGEGGVEATASIFAVDRAVMKQLAASGEEPSGAWADEPVYSTTIAGRGLRDQHAAHDTDSCALPNRRCEVGEGMGPHTSHDHRLGHDGTEF